MVNVQVTCVMLQPNPSGERDSEHAPGVRCAQGHLKAHPRSGDTPAV